MALILLLIALAPCFFLLWYFYHRDKYEPEPKKKILIIFLLGALIIIPAIILEDILIGAINNIASEIIHSFILAFIIIAPIEEFLKFYVVNRFIYRSTEFDEVMDGIVYTVSASLGFATVENIMYVLSHGITTGIVRAFLAVPGHALFGALMGYYIGLAKFNKDREIKLLLTGLLFAILTHGLYDFLIFTNTGFAAFVITLILVLAFLIRKQLKKAEIQSSSRLEDEKENDITPS
jgi:RsiW-degrading membrane proteinase PrsW (M82 family)